MTIRSEPIYLSREVCRALWLLAQAKAPIAEDHHVTADEMADYLLRQLIKDKYPQLFDHQKQIDKLEQELIKNL
jgi:hypothetical protein